MDEALRSPAPDRFWESAWTFSGSDKDRWDLKFKFYQLDSHYLQISTNPFFKTTDERFHWSAFSHKHINGGNLLSLWPADFAEDYWFKDLGRSPQLPVQVTPLIYFLIGTISSQSDISRVLTEVMGNRWWRDGDKPFPRVSSLYLSSIWFCFFLILSVRWSGFVRSCCCLWFPIRVNQPAFTSLNTSLMLTSHIW